MLSSQIQNNPVYALPFLYIQGLQINYLSSSIFSITAGQCRDSNDIIDMGVGMPNLEGNIVPAPLLVSILTNGINGLDQGTIAPGLYSIYIIGDSRYYNPVGAILTLSSNLVPLLPFGYDSYRLIGYINVSAGPVIVPFWMNGSGNDRTFSYGQTHLVLLDGNATTFTNMNLSTYVPSIPNVLVNLQVYFTPAAAGDAVSFRPHGSTQPSFIPALVGQVAGVQIDGQIALPQGNVGSVYGIEYAVTASGDSASVGIASYTVSL